MGYSVEDLMTKDFNELVRENPSMASAFMSLMLQVEECAWEKGFKGQNQVRLGRISMEANGKVNGEFSYTKGPT